MSQSNLQIVQGVYESFARGDAAAVLAAMDPAIVWNEAEGFLYADRNPYVGPAAIAEGIFLRFATEWDGFQVTPQEFLEAGEAVVALGRYTGKHKASGVVMDAQFAHVWRLRDRKVTNFQQFTDTAQSARIGLA